ncbi:hypothetical protein X801_03086 [Opisthorchis viverrini]|uniref:Phosphofurin acidic cluster sorting protein 1/2 N-terminal C2 domain-containing protein n=1 Tax=Opisthorchis viverrini TaxID=6198 RepID=A0A1S8X2X4_OPIVI|nr:hypothetical protein X801_03086 [Opisthorchis viverrini]
MSASWEAEKSSSNAVPRIQYSHMLNRDANTLQILLQRRKKYKSKTMNLGYKTLAYCNVNLAQVLQKRIENRFLELYTDPNCTTHPVGRVEVQVLSTVPLDKDLVNGKRKEGVREYGLNPSEIMTTASTSFCLLDRERIRPYDDSIILLHCSLVTVTVSWSRDICESHYVRLIVGEHVLTILPAVAITL